MSIQDARSVRLPACRTDSRGRRHIDWRVVGSLATPFIANSAIQAVLNLTDTWFIGRISTQDVAAIGAVYWLVLVFILLLGGVGLAVQTLVSQAYGAGRLRRAAQAVWLAIWASVLTAPVFAWLAFGGASVLAPFELDPAIERAALEYWAPRMGFAWIGVALWSVLGFFNGIGLPRVTLLVTIAVATLNAIGNQIFIFELGFGIAGAAWATVAATAIGFGAAIAIFASGSIGRQFAARLVWRLKPRRLAAQFRLGFPMGLLFAADLLGFALFQLMQVHLSAVDGAATQIAMMLTSIAYYPAAGLAMAGTTLVGQSIGAGDRSWARQIGNSLIVVCMTYMTITGVAVALCGRPLTAFFIEAADPLAPHVIALGAVILWIAAAYQSFDGLNLAASFCLRGAGDAFVPAMLVLVLSWLLFIPLAHMLTYERGQGWVEGLPQFGLGAIGGWIAAVVYIAALGLAMLMRWRSRAWEGLRVG